jgi:hypothetical protein
MPAKAGIQYRHLDLVEFQLYSSFIQSEPVIRQAKESLRLGVIPHTKAALWP